MNVITQSNIMFVLGLVGILFAVYRYFREPQVKSTTNILLLSQQLNDLQKQLVNLRDNHIHSLDVKMDQTSTIVTSISIELAKLNTIIDERIPRKQ